MLTPARLAETAAALATVERSLTDVTTRIGDRCGCIERVAADLPAWWSGRRADAYRSSTDAVAASFRTLPAPIADARATVSRTRQVAAELSDRLTTIDRRRAHQLGLLLRYGRDVEHTWSTPDDTTRAHATIRSLDRDRDEIEAHWAGAGRAAAHAIVHLASTIPVVDAAVPFAPTITCNVKAGETSDGRPAPADVAAWWSELAPADRRAMVRTVPDVIGNLDGIPIADRVAANHRSMQAALDAAEHGSERWTTMQQFTLRSEPHEIDRERRFLVFDPAGDGLVAEMFGDVVSAEHVAVMVPGMGSTMAGFDLLSQRAARLRVASGSGTAIIAWKGYDTPAAAAVSPRTFEVTSDRRATAGGLRLRGFVDGLRSESCAPITLIGHSYGSLTVGKALQDGARVERVVFMGSPGVGVDHVDEFPADAAHEYFASEIKGDIVANLEHFGSNPTDPDFGASVFDSGDGDGRNPVSRHGEYYDEGVAIENLAEILTGGTPTPGRTDLVEYLTEPFEDIDEGVGDLIDRWQDLDIPFVDDTWIDHGTEWVRGVHDATSQLGEIVVEEIGHFGQDAAEWGADRAGDAWERGTDLVTGWLS